MGRIGRGTGPIDSVITNPFWNFKTFFLLCGPKYRTGIRFTRFILRGLHSNSEFWMMQHACIKQRFNPPSSAAALANLAKVCNLQRIYGFVCERVRKSVKQRKPPIAVAFGPEAKPPNRRAGGVAKHILRLLPIQQCGCCTGNPCKTDSCRVYWEGKRVRQVLLCS